MQTAIGYLRVSTREQGRSGLGLAAQRFEIEAFGAREGFPVKSCMTVGRGLPLSPRDD
jgi:DNA invertase Pin-like site-specific DNA recombinase